MKKRFLILVSTLLTLPLLTVGTVMAQHGSDDSTTSTTDTSTTDTDHDRAERLKAREDKLKLVLGVAEKSLIKNRCVSAQGKIRSLEGRIKGIQTSRTHVYANIEASLTKISAKIKVKGLDTTTLDTEIATLKTKVDTFNTNLTNYKQAVTDLAAMDCKADPVAFKASLETARTLRQTLFTSSQEIKTYVKETIRPTLVTLKTQLEASDTTDTDTNTNSTSN